MGLNQSSYETAFLRTRPNSSQEPEFFQKQVEKIELAVKLFLNP